jgi:hypothetical protein
MVLVGLVLLLPGVCAVGALSQPHLVDPAFLPIVVIGLLVGFGGLMLIWSALRERRP